MYTIHADGQLLFDSLSEDVQSIALSPKLILDINKAGSLALVLPPGNALHGRLQKLKSTLTVEQDGAELFRGRVMETETDTWNQQRIYSEGEKAFLLDSLQAPYTYSGTVHGLFRQFVANHNSMVEAGKQFTVGTITAVGDSETTAVENDTYASTSSEIENRLLNAYGGYLRTRTANGVHYIDWVKQYGNESAQPIEFAVNLLDLTDKNDASDVFTVLIPLGASGVDDEGEYIEPVSIASVNNGLNYIQNDEAVALYGKIWRSYTWSEEEDPAKLLEKANEYLKTGVAFETLTLKAVDMHFVDGNVQPILIGDRVRILSNPHGLDKVLVCSQIEIDLLNPENTVYTFGERPRTLTENFVKAEEEVEELTGHHGGGGGVKKEIGELKRWAQLKVTPELGRIDAIAWDINDLTGRTSTVELYMDAVEAVIKLKAERSIFNEFDDRISSAEIDIDGANAAIALKASQTTVDSLANRVSQAEIDIDGANAQIALKADTTVTDALGTRVSSAEIAIDGLEGEIELKVSKDGVISSINQTAEEITINANKINLSGYVTTSTLTAELATFENIFAGNANADYLYANHTIGAQTGQFTNISLINYDCQWKQMKMGDITGSYYLARKTEDVVDLKHSHKVTVDESTGLVTLGEVSEEGGNFNIADTTYYKNGVSAAYNNGKTDWSPVEIQRTGYSTEDKTVTTRAVNAAGVPLIALEDIDASEIYEAGEQNVMDGVVIGANTPSSITDLGNNVYQMKVTIWAKYNGETIQSTTVYLTKGLY